VIREANVVGRRGRRARAVAAHDMVLMAAVSRETHALLLALLGAAALRISVTDAFLAYVREPMRPLLIASGVLLLGLAAWSLWRVSGQAERVEDEAAATAGT
jgi:cytochrome c biogenesis factor